MERDSLLDLGKVCGINFGVLALVLTVDLNSILNALAVGATIVYTTIKICNELRRYRGTYCEHARDCMARKEN